MLFRARPKIWLSNKKAATSFETIFVPWQSVECIKGNPHIHSEKKRASMRARNLDRMMFFFRSEGK